MMIIYQIFVVNFKGYVRMKMNNTCGIASFVMWPVLDGEKYLNPLNSDDDERVTDKVDEDEHLRN
jgi:hypothetical protein